MDRDGTEFVGCALNDYDTSNLVDCIAGVRPEQGMGLPAMREGRLAGLAHRIFGRQVILRLDLTVSAPAQDDQGQTCQRRVACSG